MLPPPPSSTLFPYTTLFRSGAAARVNLIQRGLQLLDVGGKIARRVEIRRVIEVHHKRLVLGVRRLDRKSTRLNSSHVAISYAVFCLKKKTTTDTVTVLLSIS